MVNNSINKISRIDIKLEESFCENIKQYKLGDPRKRNFILFNLSEIEL